MTVEWANKQMGSAVMELEAELLGPAQSFTITSVQSTRCLKDDQHEFRHHSNSPDRRGSPGWAPSCTAKGWRFDSQSGGNLQVVPSRRRARGNWLMFLSLSLFLLSPLSKKIIKITVIPATGIGDKGDPTQVREGMLGRLQRRSVESWVLNNTNVLLEIHVLITRPKRWET